MTFDNKGIILQPTEKLSEELKEKIKKLNDGKPNFPTYCERVRELFKLQPIQITEKQCNFFAGFIEGEGCISIGAKKNKNARFGVELDPNFNITQHINGVKHLYFALEVFQTGRIRYKEGSNATLVFIIEPRLSLKQKVCPFIEEYVYPLSCEAKQIRYTKFKTMLDLFDDGAHLDKERLINELLPIWDSIRVQTGYAGETFGSLEIAQDFVRNH